MKNATPTKQAAQVADWLRSVGYEVDVMQPSLLAVRVPTRQLELPLVVQVEDIVFFDLYPFRFVPVRVAQVDWPFLVQLATDTQLVKICVDLETGGNGAAPLFYSVQLPFEVLSEALAGGVVDLLKSFAEERHDVVMRAVHLASLTGKKKKTKTKKKPARKTKKR